jgi:hypothetical protein
MIHIIRPAEFNGGGCRDEVNLPAVLAVYAHVDGHGTL